MDNCAAGPGTTAVVARFECHIERGAIGSNAPSDGYGDTGLTNVQRAPAAEVGDLGEVLGHPLLKAWHVGKATAREQDRTRVGMRDDGFELLRREVAAID